MRIRSLVLALLLCAPAVMAQLGSDLTGGVTPPDIKLEGSVQKRSGDLVEGTLVVTIPPTWHINSAKPLDQFAIPTVITLDPATAELTGTQYPPHELKNFAFSGGSQVAVYEGTIRIPFTAKLKGGANEIGATLRYQSCNDRVCLPPKSISTKFSAAAVAGSAAPATAAPTAPATGGTAFTPLSAAPRTAAPSGPSSDDKLATTFASSGLPLTLLVLFALGMALNLTPCVFPMIPITMGFFAMQSDGRRSRRFALSALYVLGIVIMYSALGVVASLSGKMFGAWLQSPAVQIGFAALMVVLAASMFGAYDIGVPQFIAKRAMGRAGYAGAMTMGLLVGIVAAPCVGPVVVSLITLVASIGKPMIGFVMFAALALGLGFPYLVMLNALPRPGEWMVHVKKAMGFVLVGMAFYFLRPLIGDEWFTYGLAGSLLVGAAFLFFMSRKGQQARVLRVVCASVLLVGGIAFLIPWNRGGVHLDWQHYEASVLATATTAKQPVVIDFYADWCIPCKELDSKTFSNPAVASELKRFQRVKANLTLPDDPKTQALTKQYAIVGVPTIVFLDENGQELRNLRLTGYEEPGKFVERLQQVR